MCQWLIRFTHEKYDFATDNFETTVKLTKKLKIKKNKIIIFYKIAYNNFVSILSCRGPLLREALNLCSPLIRSWGHNILFLTKND